MAGGRAPLHVSTNGYTLSNRSGTNWNSAPYADSIPDTCGGVIERGLWAVFDAPAEGPTGPTPPPGSTITPPGGAPITLGGDAYVQAVTMPDYLGYDQGEPMPSDRGAFLTDTEPHASLHAEDIRRNIDDGDSTLYHLPTNAAVGEVPMWDGTGYAPEDVLTPAEHTAIGDGAPHHAAVTLGANPGLSLSTQELVLGTPSTLTVSTTNAVTGANHTHAITASAAPGATESLLKSAPTTGLLTLAALTATTGKFDHIGEATGAHTIVFDNTVTLPASTLVLDGGTIGQAAGPLLTFDDSNNYLEITGCKVGIGTATPTYPLTIYAASDAYISLVRATDAVHAAFVMANDGAISASNLLWAAGKRATEELFSIWSHNGGTDVVSMSASRTTVTIPMALLVSADATRTIINHPGAASYHTFDFARASARRLGMTLHGNSDNFVIYRATGAAGAESETDVLEILNANGNIGIKTLVPTAALHLPAGSAAASTAPLKFTSGTLLTTAEVGAVEFLTDDYFLTITTGAARKAFVLDDGARLTSGKMPVAHTNGRLIDLTASSAYTPSNVSADRSYDANSTALDEIADVLGTLIADLQVIGVLG